MRQAIEEGFILDVLKNYTTYATYFKLLKACEDDPNVERKKAALALARFMRLHPHNIAQKTEVMVEHFNTVTRHKIGGQAKAMVVTGSRLEAVATSRVSTATSQARAIPSRSLVAFSGTVMTTRFRRQDLHRRGDERRHPGKGTAGEVRHARNTRCCSWPRNTRPALTSRFCTPCMWTNGWRAFRRCRRSPA